jgi:hypothetical protein
VLDKRQSALYHDWLALKPPGGGLPLRRDFDPIDNPQSMSTLVLAEVVKDDLLFRVVGTDMVQAWGSDFTGKPLSEVMQGAYHTFIRGLFDETIESGRCLFSHSRFQWDREHSLDTRRLMLPFADEKNPQRACYVLVSQVFEYGQMGPERPIIQSEETFEIDEITRRVLTESD